MSNKKNYQIPDYNGVVGTYPNTKLYNLHPKHIEKLYLPISDGKGGSMLGRRKTKINSQLHKQRYKPRIKNINTEHDTSHVNKKYRMRDKVYGYANSGRKLQLDEQNALNKYLSEDIKRKRKKEIKRKMIERHETPF